MLTLERAILAAHARWESRSLEELKATLEFPQYRDWVNYERLREKNIEAAYRNLKLYR